LISIDTNGDGRVDFTEFISAAYNRTKLVSEKNLEIAFKMFDIDGNG
jgi:calcium-dependent protein kinase